MQKRGKGRETGTVPTKRNKGSEPTAAGASLDADVTAELERQYRAMEESLRSYVDQRVSAAEAARPSRGAAPADTRDRGEAHGRNVLPPRQMTTKVVAIVIAVMVLAGSAAAWFYFRKPAAETVSAAAVSGDDTAPRPAETSAPREPEVVRDEPAADVRLQAVSAAITAASADGKWAESLKNLLASQPELMSASMQTAAEGTGLEANAVAPAARKELIALAQRVAAKGALTSEHRGQIRQLLFAYVAALAARDLGSAATVSAKPRTPAPRVVQRLRDQYKPLTRGDDVTMELQSEIILRWMQANAR
jgi:hypothetical protein